MEWLVFFAKGLLIGFVASIPLGPIGMVCIQRTLTKSQRSGFFSGIGAATADTLYAAIAAFFLSVVMAFVERNIDLLRVIGGICVIIVGVSIFLKNPVVQIRRNRAGKGSLWSDFLSGFLLTLANPAFILVFLALFATFGISIQGDVSYYSGTGLIGGVLVGASLWWFGLTAGVSLFRRHFRPRHMLYLNRISGALIVGLGASVILSLFTNISMNGIVP